jgi:H/ACA ribonucleoprotein complex subunit 4
MENEINELLKASFLNIDKPSGPTSHDVCEIVKKILNIPKNSHSGTLDPKVTGVLGMGIGKAARLLRFLPSDKVYVGVMRIHEDIPEEKLREVIKEFTGKIRQTPPVKSRVKREEREREVYSFEILEKNKQDVLFKVHCEAGTYIRKLIHDLGQKLGVGAHMTELRRTRAGIFSEENSLTLYQLDEIVKKNELSKHLIPINIITKYLPSFEVKKENLKELWNGSPLYPEFLENKEDINRLEKLKKDRFIALTHDDNLIEVAKLILEGRKIAVPETVIKD